MKRGDALAPCVEVFSVESVALIFFFTNDKLKVK